MNQHIIFFDGVCNLCNGLVQWIIKHDHQKKFLFASLQSDAAKKYLGEDEVEKLSSIVYLKNETIFRESSAVLQIAKTLGGVWKSLFVFIIVPKFIRDSVYRFVGKNRYKWFGKKEECYLPTPELKARFLD